MAFRNSLVVVLVVTLLGFTCCGREEALETEQPPSPVLLQQDPPKVISACSLLTAEEAAEILGEPVEKPIESTTGNTISNCNWLTASFNSIGILVRRGYNAAEAESAFDLAYKQSKSLSGVDPEDISGLGEKAYWAGGRINQLNVYAGNYWLIIMANPDNSQDPLSVAKLVAVKALAKLT
ncbi:MAG TPA: hypothetical protein PLP42_04035 [Acidobacteriota bacterium]|nr:hypothetical protein [Acidobacteriota bacterium]